MLHFFISHVVSWRLWTSRMEFHRIEWDFLKLLLPLQLSKAPSTLVVKVGDLSERYGKLWRKGPSCQQQTLARKEALSRPRPPFAALVHILKGKRDILGPIHELPGPELVQIYFCLSQSCFLSTQALPIRTLNRMCREAENPHSWKLPYKVGPFLPANMTLLIWVDYFCNQLSAQGKIM